MKSLGRQTAYREKCGVRTYKNRSVGRKRRGPSEVCVAASRASQHGACAHERASAVVWQGQSSSCRPSRSRLDSGIGSRQMAYQ